MGSDNTSRQRLQEQFPGTFVRQLDTGTDLAAAGEGDGETFDYIMAAGLTFSQYDVAQLFIKLLSLLKPGGVIAAAVYGYAGYYGLNMLGAIVKKFAAGMNLKNSPGNKDFAKVRRIVKAVIQQLPSNHPAFKRKEFIEDLKSGDKKVLTQLLGLSDNKIFTVSQLLECIETIDGRFMDWVIPKFYDPAQYIETGEITGKLTTLPD
ncbi:MAG: hypothetical protein GY940_04900, partial [bacterium]|nr:hypothetical protein [bacterium]